MYLSLPSATLSDILRRAKLAMDGKPRLPILGTARFTVSPDGRFLDVASTDLDLTLIQRIPLEDPGGPGSACLDLKQLAALRPDKNTPVRIDYTPHAKKFRPGHADSQCLYVAAGHPARAEIDAFPATEFPAPPDIPATDHLCLLPGKTLQALAASLPFQSKDQTRYVLNGAAFDPEMGGTIVATDGRRLFHTPAKVTPEAIIIPTKTCLALARLGPAAASAAIHEHTYTPSSSTTRFLSLRGPGWQVISKLIEGNYPNFRQVIPHPESLTSSLTFTDPEGVAKWLRSLGENSCVTLRPRAPHFVDLAQDKVRRLTTAARLKGEPPAIAFNPRFLADALHAVPGTLHLSDERSPGVLRTPTALVALMPMRVTTEESKPKAEAAA